MAAPDLGGNPSCARRRSPWPLQRTLAVARVTFRQMARMRIGLLVPLAILVLIVTDLSSPRFDLVFEGIPAAISTTLLTLAVLAILFGVFIATYTIPSEIETKIAHTVYTKPLSRAEYIAGKVFGLSAMLLLMIAVVSLVAYLYMHVRSRDIQTLAAQRLEEARTWVAHPADLNAVEAVAHDGPLQVYRYDRAATGPDVAILRDPDSVQPSDANLGWILGNTGMKLRWDLSDLPLAQWAAEGPLEMRLHLATRAPAVTDPDKPPSRLVVGLIPIGAPTSVLRHKNTDQQYDRTIPLSDADDVSIPIVPAQASAGDTAIQVAPDKPVSLQVYATGDGVLLGAGVDAVQFVRSSGQIVTVTEPLEVRPSSGRGGRWELCGRSTLPRQVAVFRFDPVAAADLPERRTAVEIGFSFLSLGSATTPSAAEAIFVNPTTGRRLAMQFTPEGYHATILYLDRDFWNGGPLEVRLQSLTDDDSLGLLPESVRLRIDGGPFAWNLAKITAAVWLFGTILTAFGVLLSSIFGWFVSALGNVRRP